MLPRDDSLDELLRRTDRVPESSTDVPAEVHRRIAAARIATEPSWVTRLDAIFGRPSFAATFLVACVLLGLFLAEARLSRLHAARSAEVARSYVQLIDPLLAPVASSPSAAQSP